MTDSGSPNPEREDRILDAAAKLFTRYGFDKTTVSEIAGEAGVSKGAVYLHWKSKDDLFEALIYREGERLVEDVIVRMESDPDSGTIFGLYQHSILAVIANPLIFAIMTRDHRVTGDFVRRWSQGDRASEANLFRLEFVEQLQAAGVIRRDLDANVIAYVLAMIRYGFLMVGDVYPADRTPPLDQVGRALADMLERALAPEGGADREAGRKALAQVMELMRAMVHRQRQTRQTTSRATRAEGKGETYT